MLRLTPVYGIGRCANSPLHGRRDGNCPVGSQVLHVKGGVAPTQTPLQHPALPVLVQSSPGATQSSLRQVQGGLCRCNRSCPRRNPPAVVGRRGRTPADSCPEGPPHTCSPRSGRSCFRRTQFRPACAPCTCPSSASVRPGPPLTRVALRDGGRQGHSTNRERSHRPDDAPPGDAVGNGTEKLGEVVGVHGRAPFFLVLINERTMIIQ